MVIFHSYVKIPEVFFWGVYIYIIYCLIYYCLRSSKWQDFWVIMTKRYPRNRHGYSHRTSWGESEHGESPQNTSFNREHDCWTMGLMGFNVRWDFGWFWDIPFFDKAKQHQWNFLHSASAKKSQKLAWLRSWSMKCWSAIWSRLASAFLQESIAPPPGLSYQLFPGWVGLIQPGFIWWGWECYGIHIVGMGLLWITYILSRSTAEEPRTSWSARTSIARQVGAWTCTAIEDGENWRFNP